MNQGNTTSGACLCGSHFNLGLSFLIFKTRCPDRSKWSMQFLFPVLGSNGLWSYSLTSWILWLQAGVSASTLVSAFLIYRITKVHGNTRAQEEVLNEHLSGTAANTNSHKDQQQRNEEKLQENEVQREDRTEREATGNRNAVIQDIQKKHSRNWWMEAKSVFKSL